MPTLSHAIWACSLHALPNGDVIIEAEGRSDFFIIQALLRYRANAELLEPDWLREKMIEEVYKLAVPGLALQHAARRCQTLRVSSWR